MCVCGFVVVVFFLLFVCLLFKDSLDNAAERRSPAPSQRLWSLPLLETPFGRICWIIGLD